MCLGMFTERDMFIMLLNHASFVEIAYYSIMMVVRGINEIEELEKMQCVS